MIYVTDMSQYQCTQDMTKKPDFDVLGKYFDGFYFRSGFATGTPDPAYPFYLQEVKRIGKPFGVYHYVKLEKSLDEQVKFIKGLIAPNDRYIGDMPFAADIEKVPSEWGAWEFWNAFNKFYKKLDEALAGVDMPVWKFGRVTSKYTCYSRASFIDRFGMGVVDLPKYLHWWIAHYPWDKFDGPAEYPVVWYNRPKWPNLPMCIENINNPLEEYLWQFTGYGNKLARSLGVPGDDDLDIGLINMDWEQYKEFVRMPDLIKAEEFPWVSEPVDPPAPPPPPPIEDPVKIKISGVGSGARLNMRAAPWSTVVGSTFDGAQFPVVDTVLDTNGKKWYGIKSYIASWYATKVE